ncbi:uncharacterized protein LOC121467226 [Drosophila elegans]|uniref:uncharacterized protein LOC121467226 n=1 Tax=Drosophila elegans TaxID=30023 RepID=UPI001BC8401C|nr:uncharacterized protein LOC121467226 [Drosophila elegans]
MTFGISCAPCIAHYVRDKNAKEYKLKSPRAFEAITEAHYVDDYIDSLADETEAIKVSLEVRDIHAAGGFNIRNWASNSPEVLKHLLGDSITLQPAKELGDAEKVLDFTELHTFVDASEFGYAAVCYFRIGKGDDITISLVAAKSKVARLKPLSIPRMKLLAALTGARLSQKVRNTRNIKTDEHIYWTDSRTVISWLTMDPRNFYAFVMHRVGEIMETTNASQWHWVPTKLNVADMATKFTSKPNPEEWVNGPHFLRQSRNQWPKQPDVCTFQNVKCDEIRRTVMVMRRTSVKAIPLNVECFSDWKRLKAQQDGFKTELDTLQSSQNITKPSALIGFNVYVDDAGIMRTQGRADSINQNRDQIVLPKHNHITHLVVKDFHEKNHHMLHEGTINLIRNMYFIPQLRIVYKSVRKSCQICKNNSAIPEPPQMASLPSARIASFERPFTYTGVDFFGPILVTVGRHKEKRWGVIFTCLTLRAVHIEIAYSLDTSSCVMCLTNFMSRRGTPKEIFSDNGTNFRATEKIVKEELKNIDFGKLVIKYDQIKWRFNPPAAPHMGGAWERLIRSIKLVIKSISPNSNYNDESLRNALLSAEYVINSRPLTFVSLEAEDDDALTTNHLLLGSADGYKPTVTTELNPRQRWCQAQELADLFWKRCNKQGYKSKNCPGLAAGVQVVRSANRIKKVTLNGVEVKCLVDSGADVSVLRKFIFNKIPNVILEKSESKLRGLGKKITCSVGRFFADVAYAKDLVAEVPVKLRIDPDGEIIPFRQSPSRFAIAEEKDVEKQIDEWVITNCVAFKKTLQWIIYMQDFEFTVEHHPGERLKHIDCHSRYPNRVMLESLEITARLKNVQGKDEMLKAIMEILATRPYEGYKMKGGLVYKDINGNDLFVVP